MTRSFPAAFGVLHEDKLCDTLQAMTPTNQCQNDSSNLLTPYREQPRTTLIVVANPRPGNFNKIVISCLPKRCTHFWGGTWNYCLPVEYYIHLGTSRRELQTAHIPVQIDYCSSQTDLLCANNYTHVYFFLSYPFEYIYFFPEQNSVFNIISEATRRTKLDYQARPNQAIRLNGLRLKVPTLVVPVV